MKNSFRIFLLLTFALQLGLANAQLVSHVRWTTGVEQTKPGEAILVITADVDDEWHIFSQHTPDGGSLPTVFTFEPNKNYELIGKVEEPKPQKYFEELFGVDVYFFEGDVVMRQKVKLKGDNFKIRATVSGQVCKEVCENFLDVPLTFIIGNPSAAIDEKQSEPVISSVPQVDNSDSVNQVENTTPKKQGSYKEMVAALEPGCGSGDDSKSYNSLMGVFLAGMLGGIFALITPCIFPMIPLTVSFFTKRSTSKRKGIFNAVVYAISIMVIYVGLGLIITVSRGPDALNEMASNVYFNLLFFVIFLLFAFSFFGAFEITLPSSWVNKADAASEKGGLIGIFFMAFTLSLVSFSCTAAIIGALLVEAARGSYLGPVVGMAGFSFALALPFALFAAFPAWLHSLPKSGGWLNSVKVVLGFLELALALKFLSNVDLAYHWGILYREIFIALWIIIFGLMGLYLLGKIKFSHDSDVKHISIPRLMLAVLTLSFTLYMIPGLWGAPLKLISGILPPDFYKEWRKNQAHDCPHDLNCFHDYDEGMAYARKQGKPVMVDFTGWSCVNCRRMEDNVWSEPRVFKRLSEDYVLISLYVDDKTPLPEGDRISKYTQKKINTVGNKWSNFQIGVYESNSQPYYVLLDNQGNLLAKPEDYTPEVSDYLKFLDEGLCRYKIRKTSAQVAAN